MTTFHLHRKRCTKDKWVLTRQGSDDWWDYCRKEFRGSAQKASCKLQVGMMSMPGWICEWKAPDDVAKFMTGMERNRVK